MYVCILSIYVDVQGKCAIFVTWLTWQWICSLMFCTNWSSARLEVPVLGRSWGRIIPAQPEYWWTKNEWDAVTTRASKEGSRIFHKHAEGPYHALLKHYNKWVPIQKRKDHNWCAALRIDANQTTHPSWPSWAQVGAFNQYVEGNCEIFANLHLKL